MRRARLSRDSCGASPRCAIAAWPRTWHGRRPCSRWPISTRCAANCSRRESDVSCDRQSFKETPSRSTRGAWLPRKPRLLFLTMLTFYLEGRRITTCAELPEKTELANYLHQTTGLELSAR